MGSPNTLFTAGSVYTAAQCNAFPRGLMAAVAESTTTDSTITAEEVMLTYTFTAVNGRNYLLTYNEPNLTGSAAATLTVRFRKTDISGTILNTTRTPLSTTLSATSTNVLMYNATASGSLTIVATVTASAGTATATRSSSQIAQLWAVDMGTI